MAAQRGEVIERVLGWHVEHLHCGVVARSLPVFPSTNFGLAV
jgi:hypothetical protein